MGFIPYIARRFATRIRAIRANRFARIDSQKKTIKKSYFPNVRAIRANRLKPAIRHYLAPRNAIRRKKGFSSGTLKRFARIGSSKFTMACMSFIPLQTVLGQRRSLWKSFETLPSHPPREALSQFGTIHESELGHSLTVRQTELPTEDLQTFAERTLTRILGPQFPV